MKILILPILCLALSSCASLLSHSEVETSYDEFKKVWTITSTRWGTDFTNIGPNPSFIRTYVKADGTVEAHVYSRIKTSESLRPEYAMTLDGKKYSAKSIDSDVNCSKYGCYWLQDTIIDIDLQEIAEQLGNDGHFKMRVYGRVPAQDIAVLACQFWEVTKEINKLKKIDLSKQGIVAGPSCLPE